MATGLASADAPQVEKTSETADAPQVEKTSERLRTKSLVIVDQNGKDVALLTGLESGAMFYMPGKTPDSHIQISTLMGETYLSVSEKGTGLMLAPDHISITPNGVQESLTRNHLIKKVQEGQEITDEERKLFLESIGKPSVWIGTGADRNGVIEVFNPAGNVVASLQGNKENHGALYLNSSGGESKVAIDGGEKSGGVDVFNQ
jgi:hypothetical protein